MDPINYLFIVIYIIFILFLFVYVPIHIVKRVRTGKNRQPITYSFKTVFIASIQSLLAIILVSFLVYYFSKSFEAAIGLGAFLTACVLAGLVQSLLREQRIKGRGGEKAE
jgi:uncharacterized membrane protein